MLTWRTGMQATPAVKGVWLALMFEMVGVTTKDDGRHYKRKQKF